MDSVIQKKYFIGKSKPGTWSSVYTYKPSSQSIKDKRGEIFAVICLEGPKDYGLPTVGNMLLDKFHETYFENANDSPLIALEKATIELGKYLQKFLENDNAGVTGIELDFASLVSYKDLVYIVGIGDGTLLIHRDGQITDVSEILKDPTMEGLIKEASFVTKPNDVYFLGTPKTRTELMHEEFSAAADLFNEQTLKNHMYKDESKIAFMMVGVSIDRKQPELSKQVIKEENQNENRVILNGKLNDETPVKEEVPAEVVPEIKIEEEEEQGETIADLLSQETAMQEKQLQDDVLDKNDLGEIEESLEVEAGEALTHFEPAEVNEERTEELEVEAEVESEIEKNVDLFEVPLQGNVGPVAPIIPVKMGFLSKIKNIFKKKENTEVPNYFKPREIQTYEQEATRPAKTTATRLAQQDLKTYQVVLLKIKDAFFRLLKGIKKLVWNNWLGFDGDDLYLKSAAAKQRKWGLLIVIVLVVVGLLYFSIQSLIESQNQKRIEETAFGHLDAAVKIITDVNSQASILAKASGNSERKAAELVKLTNAQAELELAKTVTKYTEEIAKQEQIITSIKDRFDKTIPITELNYLVDFAGKSPNANITDMVVYDKKIYVIDDQYNKLYSVDYSGNVSEIVSGLNKPRSITVDDKGNLIILDSDPDKSIAFVNPSTKTITRMSATSDSKLSGVSQIEFYTLSTQESRIYLINKSDKSIGFYSRTGNAYGTYVKRNSMDEFATAKDFKVIDDRIYILMQKNIGLYRDLGKKEDSINVSGLKTNDNLLSATAIYVDGFDVYVADPVGKRVLVFLKGTPDIPLVAQYVYRGSDASIFTDFKEIYADYNDNKIFVLSNSKVFILDMNSLNEFKL